MSPSSEGVNCAGTQELSSILWNPKVHYRVHKSPPLLSILTHINTIYTIPSYLSDIHFNIVRSPTSVSSQWSLTFWLSHQYPICILLLLHSCYMPHIDKLWLNILLDKCQYGFTTSVSLFTQTSDIEGETIDLMFYPCAVRCSPWMVSLRNLHNKMCKVG
jgi:hypothetical protein